MCASESGHAFVVRQLVHDGNASVNACDNVSVQQI